MLASLFAAAYHVWTHERQYQQELALPAKHQHPNSTAAEICIPLKVVRMLCQASTGVPLCAEGSGV